ncbi:TPA: hypothetical protein N0F65_002808 [Lagenidium giganteum]|uniref:Uncharacterized protein n=1 Tax=Lagenidium giganteum TaxID=4803 RepID=A0AAV2ZBQ9_9STRA|nr:TPA: hypothetical protein N0F65_002808 [Lagenidium giganteum]
MCDQEELNRELRALTFLSAKKR